MSNLDRAAQFSPFAALTGYDDAVEEMAKKNTAEQLELEKPVDMDSWDPGSEIREDWDREEFEKSNSLPG